MTGNHTMVRDPDSDFSFGVRELRQADARDKLSVNSAPLRPVNEQRGVDPYNTSANFDRKKNCARIGKR